MKIAVACGGTGGHSFPGLAVAEELVRRGHEVVVFGSGRSIESSVLKSWTGETFSTGAKTLKLRNLPSIVGSFWRCRCALKRFGAEAVLAMGSYSSLPPVLAARSIGLRVYLHEANAVPGKAVEFLAHFATKVAISFEVTARYLPEANTVFTGLPVREAIGKGTRFEFVPPDAFTVFVTGGSQGAHQVNLLLSEALVRLKSELSARSPQGRPLYVIHQTGAADADMVAEKYRAAEIPCRVRAFETEMADAFATADIVVARAGASTCFELASAHRPALLIPLPTAIRDHQHLNAEAFVAAGAADEGIQSELTPRQICRYLLQKYDHPERLQDMAEKMGALANCEAARKVAEMVSE